jgi:hypothetical protein
MLKLLVVLADSDTGSGWIPVYIAVIVPIFAIILILRRKKK